MTVYFNGEFIPKQKVRVSPDDRGFLLADGAYEVVRSYNGRLFKPEEHFARMDRSLRELRIAHAPGVDFRDIAVNLMRRNDFGSADARLYFQVTRGVAPRTHSFPDMATVPTVYASISALEPPLEKCRNGVKVILVPDIRWARCDIKSIALLPNVLASQEARENDAEEAVFVRDGQVTEGSHTSFCAVFDGQLLTHPEGSRILSGVTRGVVLDLCAELEIPVRQVPIPEQDLDKADELMLVGTGVDVMPVVRVNDRAVGAGRPGPITVKLQEAFRQVTRQTSCDNVLEPGKL